MQKTKNRVIERVYPLTSTQEGMLFHKIWDEQSTSYVVQEVMTLQSDFQSEWARQALDLLAERHAMLRTAIVYRKVSKPQQVLFYQRKIEFEEMDLSALSQEEQHRAIQEWKEADVRRGFDLEQDSLLRIKVLACGERHFKMIWSFHHIIMDGWCLSIVCSDFVQYYTALRNGTSYAALLAAVQEEKVRSGSYEDYVKWIKRQNKEESLAYWKSLLSDYETVAEVGSNGSDPSTSLDVQRISVPLTQEISEQIARLSAQHQVTANIFFETVWGTLLQRHTGTKDVVFGKVVSGRNAPLRGIEEMVGLFINTIPVRVKSEQGYSFTRLAKQLQWQAVESGKHDYCSLGEVQTYSEVGSDTIRTLMIFENFHEKSEAEQLESIFQIETDVYREQTNYAVNLMISFTDVFSLDLMYDPSRYTEQNMEQLMEQLLRLIDGIVQKPDQALDEIALISDQELKRIEEMNRETVTPYAQDQTVHALFEQQVSRSPEAIALVDSDHSLSYVQLNEKANQLARALQLQGLKPGEVVGILVGRTADMLVSMLAVLKTGAAYLPIDPEHPADRVQYMLEDSGTRFLLVNQEKSDAIELHFAGKCLNPGESLYADFSPFNLDTKVSADDLAYLIYTSGSTGKPKGVMLEHRSVHNFIVGMNQEIGFEAGKTMLNSTSMGFDIFVVESLLSLIKGLRIIIASENEQKDPALMRKLIEKHAIDMMQMTPSRLKMLISGITDFSQLQSLQQILVGGEALPGHLAATLLSQWKGQLYNMYGPTETTVWSTIQLVHEGEPISIGKPIVNTRIFILDSNLNVQPEGLRGELCIGGDGLARGYLNLTELTEERFIQDPYKPGERLYRTGDLARWLPNGTIEYLGRMDEQVKIRGYRIELGEIESVLRLQSEVADAAVVAREDSSGDKYLCAYVVPVKSIAWDSFSCRSLLGEVLPDYMIPTYIIALDQLPLNRNGKLDRKALPEPQWATAAKEWIPPRNETERQVVEVFQEILGVPSLGIHDNFFECGGHSLRAIRVMNLIESRVGIRLPLQAIFDHPTPEELSRLLIHKPENEYQSIPVAPQWEDYPMTPAQKRLFFIHEMDPSNTAYHMPGSIELNSSVDVPRLRHTLNQLIERHEILRTSFHLKDGEPVQRISPAVDIELEIVDRTTQAKDSKRSNDMLLDFVRPFNVSRAPLFRLRLVKWDETKHVLLFDMHHLISDGTTIHLITRDFSMLYNGEALPPITRHYKDYSEWLRGRDLSQEKTYWLKRFEGELPVLDLPLDYTRPQIQSPRGAAITWNMDSHLRNRIQELCRKTGTTEYMVLLSGLMILLRQYSRQEDIIVGSPASGRIHQDTEQMVGLFVNTLAMRARPEAEKTYLEFLTEVQKASLEAYEHQTYPFEELADQVQMERDLSRHPLFDVMFVLQNQEEEELTAEGMSFGESEAGERSVKFDLTLQFTSSLQGYQVDWEYGRDLFKKETILRMASHLEFVLKSIVETPSQKLGDVSCLNDEEETQILYQFNDTHRPYPSEQTIHGLFEEQVRATPDALAVICPQGSMTYSKLDQAANRIREALRQQGVQPGQRVGMMGQKSIYTIAGLLGILKSGCGYVPLSSEDPPARLQFMLDDGGIGTVLHSAAYRDILAAPGLDADRFQRVELEQACANGAVDLGFMDRGPVHAHEELVGDEADVRPEPDAASIAYVIYTSGTTGQPKGVMVEHRNVIRLVRNTTYVQLEGVRMLQTGALSFDASTFEIWGALLNGGRLVLAEQETVTDGERLAQVIQEQDIQMMWMTAQLFNHLTDTYLDAFQGLVHVLVGGETLSAKHVQQVRTRYPQLRLTNGYGPTENTTFSLTYEIHTVEANIPIGQPISHSTAYIMQGQQLCGIGMPGELVVGGDGVARGYLNLPALTKERFGPDPYLPGGRVYRTGDLARWRPDGTVEYLGRLDEQVKIRGYRIELGEIERALRDLPGLDDAVVLAREDMPGEKELCAYVVPTAITGWDAAEGRQQLRARLPVYMLPADWVVLDRLPMTRNGKLDRRALPAPDRNERHTLRVAPRNETEAEVVAVFQEVLGLEEVGIHDHFFERGGHSLRAIRAVNQLEARTGIRLPLRSLFEHPTAAALSMCLGGGAEAAYEPLPRAPLQETYPMSSAQQRLFVIQQMDPASTVYNMPGRLDLPGSLDLARLQHALQTLVQRHESLRTSFHLEAGQAVQRIHPEVSVAIEYRDWKEEPGSASASEVENNEAVQEALLTQFVRPFDVGKAPLLRLNVVKTGAEEHALLFDMHHLISDGTTMNIMTRELSQLYAGESLPPVRVQYKDYSEWLRVQDREAARAYWVGEFAGELPILDLPLDYPRPQMQRFQGGVVPVELGADLRSRVQRLCRQTGATEYMVLLSGLMILLSQYSRQADIIVGSPVSGRVHPDTESTVGVFVNTLALRGYPKGAKSYVDFLMEIQETSLKALEHQTYPFEELVEQVQVQRDLSRNPLFDVMLVLQNQEEESPIKGNLDFTGVQGNTTTAKFDLTLNITSSAEGYLVQWEYMRDLFHEDTVRRMAAHYEQVIQEVTMASDLRLDQLSMVTTEEREWLFNNVHEIPAQYPEQATIKSLFEEQVKRAPGRIAATDGEITWTYAELNRQANLVAHRLLECKGPEETVVALLLERNVGMLAGILGAVKAGCTYLPMDPDAPSERIGYMLQDSQAQMLLTTSKCLEESTFRYEGTIIVLDKGLADFSASDISHTHTSRNENPIVSIVPSDALYIIYTSGTTGQPKGTLIEHRNVVRLMVNDQMPFDFMEDDVWSQFHAYNFDFSVWEMYGALLYGGKVVIVSKEIARDAPAFLKLLRQEKVTVLNQVPSSFYELMHAELAEQWDEQLHVRMIIFGGEALHFGKLGKWKEQYPEMELINMYGITETTVHVTHKRIGSGELALGLNNIGRAIPTLRLYILNGDRLCGVGMPGELCVAGAGVARGYVNRPELTQVKFVENPYEPGERMYRSGDIARWLPDGNVEYLGRLDDQVKIRGYRIELKEIENVLMKQPGVQDAVVIVQQDPTGDRYLSAYVVGGGSGGHPLDLGSIKTGLSQAMPSYMVPASLMVLEKLPLTSNGKLDRRSLPEPTFNSQQAYVAPRDEHEIHIAGLFSQVLGTEQIGIHDDFFKRGGDSIKAMRILAKLREEGYRTTIVHLLNHPSIAMFSQHLKSLNRDGMLVPNLGNSQKGSPSESLLEGKYLPSELSIGEEDIRKALIEYAGRVSSQPFESIIPMSPIQKCSYDMGIRSSMAEITFAEPLDSKRLNRAVRHMMYRHSLLRAVIQKQNNEIHILSCPDEVHIPLLDLTRHTEEEQQSVINHARSLYSIYDLDEQYTGLFPTQTMMLIKTSTNTFTLLMLCTHLVFDGMSHESFYSQLTELYQDRDEAPREQETPSLVYDYMKYVQQVEQGPVNTTQEEIHSVLRLGEFVQAVQQYQQFAEEHEWETFSYTYNMDVLASSHVHSLAWELPSRVYGEMLKQVYPNARIPVLLVQAGRAYDQEHYHDYIGEFIDFVPSVVDTQLEQPCISQMEEQIRFLRKHKINMASLLTEPHIRDRYPMVSSVFEAVYPGKMNIPIYNYLAVYQHATTQIAASPETVDVAGQAGGMITNVYLTPLGEFQMSSFCRKGQGNALKNYLDVCISDLLTERV
ncbi:non-ribosomal peptide synthetase [Paenibacillus sp. 1781tsa1]|uniref:non-ribosomal peptide synthetase n=1 Tax=Paenibacillus sp. 1781tsa1 TaxID=2953810 RepID=UPI00209E9C80|nr:non-ribosomal peptide synthetase [Paenibacillus sp. 1781tsa1]MCP1186774.1 amino acid adenylation domain-containing protein [Paenibacillus sp. 1781tsa1]